MKAYKFKLAENHLDGYNQGHKPWKSPYTKMKEGRSMVVGTKDEIGQFYDELEVMSSNDKKFKKPDFKKIDKHIEIYDDGKSYNPAP